MKFFKFEHYANSKRNTKFRLLVRPYFVQHLWMIVFCFFWGRESRIVIFWMMMTFGCRSSPPKRIGHLGSIFNQSQKFRYLTWEIRKKKEQHSLFGTSKVDRARLMWFPCHSCMGYMYIYNYIYVYRICPTHLPLHIFGFIFQNICWQE